MMKVKFKARKMIFWFRLLAVMDVLFAPKFELKRYNRKGFKNATTHFDKAEILEKI